MGEDDTIASLAEVGGRKQGSVPNLSLSPKHTTTEKPNIYLRFSFYAAVPILFISLVLSVINGLIWGYFVSVLIIGPIAAILSHYFNRIKGACPNCGNIISGKPNSCRLTCDSCQGETVVRDGVFWELPKDPEVRNRLTLPPGMTPDEFSIRKSKIKKKAHITFILMGLIPTGLFFFNIWVYGTFATYKIMSLGNLQVVQGTYFVRKYYRSRSPVYETGIKDFNSGQIVMTANDAFCRVDKVRNTFEGRPATVWYSVGPGAGKINVVYQLVVDGNMICTVEQVNQRMKEANRLIRSFSKPVIFSIGIFLIIWGAAGFFAYYGTYRQKVNQLLGRDEK